MANILDYLNWRGDLTLAQSPFNEVDNLILAELSFVNFTGIVPGPGEGEGVPLHAAAEAFFRSHEGGDMGMGVLVPDEIPTLLRKMAECPRFREMKVNCFCDHLDVRKAEQFAAVTVELGDGSIYLSFRGTDDTIAGWKEDFLLGCQPEVPAQKKAVAYVKAVAAQYPRRKLMLGGHSKGGNLAVYGGVFVPLAIQRRISAVWSNDGPGFYGAVLETPQHARLEGRVHSIVPKSSVVGMLLEHEESYTVVDSDQVGLWQHDGFSWQVLGTGFVTLREVSRQGRRNDLALKEWVRRLPVDQREKFVDGLFEVLTASGATTLTDLKEDGFRAAGAMVRAMKDMEKDTRDALFNAIATLFRSNIQAAVEEAREEVRGDGSPLRKLTELTEKIVGKE
ncbi:MAG: Mbeg1-like protein [Dysosmobacter sp.]|nr:Mbeg1-like protein [Dysosmobacter sp.]